MLASSKLPLQRAILSLNSTRTNNVQVRLFSVLLKEIKQSDIVVFRRDHCGYCDTAVSALISAGFKDKMTVITVTPELKEELIQVTKSRSLPNVWIKGKYVGGCNDGPEPWMGVMKILKQGSINKFLE